MHNELEIEGSFFENLVPFSFLGLGLIFWV
jgi:hypothetical protein